MDAIAEMIALFLAAHLSCSADRAMEERIGGSTYTVLSYTCGDQHWQAWSGWCVIESSGVKYMGMPFFLKEMETQHTWYVTRFGNTQYGRGAQLQDAYEPACGS